MSGTRAKATHQIHFEAFAPGHRARCLELFDANSPAYFAAEERAEYAAFLADPPEGYEVCVVDGAVAGAYGLIDERAGGSQPEEGDEPAEADRSAADPEPQGLRLNWILLVPAVQGVGVGSAIMRRVMTAARSRFEETGTAGPAGPVVDIAASHRSAPFFARFGAVEVRRTPDGWGPGMHRVDMLLPIE